VESQRALNRAMDTNSIAIDRIEMSPAIGRRDCRVRAFKDAGDKVVPKLEMRRTRNRLEHSKLIHALLWYRLPHIPQLFDETIVEAEQMHHGDSSVAGALLNVRVHNDVEAFGDHQLDREGLFRVVFCVSHHGSNELAA
jgi:hypothetical protein